MDSLFQNQDTDDHLILFQDFVLTSELLDTLNSDALLFHVQYYITYIRD